jgi:hypothetical protein
MAAEQLVREIALCKVTSRMAADVVGLQRGSRMLQTAANDLFDLARVEVDAGTKLSHS